MPWGAVALSVGALTVLGAFLFSVEVVARPLVRDAELDQLETELDNLEAGDHQ